MRQWGGGGGPSLAKRDVSTAARNSRSRKPNLKGRKKTLFPRPEGGIPLPSAGSQGTCSTGSFSRDSAKTKGRHLTKTEKESPFSDSNRPKEKKRTFSPIGDEKEPTIRPGGGETLFHVPEKKGKLTMRCFVQEGGAYSTLPEQEMRGKGN